MSAVVSSLYRYPVKGMTAHALQQVELAAGEAMPCDRIYAIENGPGRFDPENPQHLPKINFLMLMRNERLASLEAQFDEATQVLTIRRAGRQVARGDLSTPLGRQIIEQFLAAYMKADLRGAPKIVSAKGHNFTDVPVKCLHIVNLESVRELERAAGRPVDPLRFRANVYIEGLAAWEELRWVGSSFTLGEAEVEVIELTERCDATSVDPKSALRDLAVPSLLQRRWRRTDFGVYALVQSGGSVRIGDSLAVIKA